MPLTTLGLVLAVIFLMLRVRRLERRIDQLAERRSV